jgi:hypothetical protein
MEVRQIDHGGGCLVRTFREEKKRYISVENLHHTCLTLAARLNLASL